MTDKLQYKITAYSMVLLLVINLFCCPVKNNVVFAAAKPEQVTFTIDKEEGGGSDTYNGEAEIVYHKKDITIQYSFKEGYAAETVYKYTVGEQEHTLSNRVGSVLLSNTESTNGMYHVTFQAVSGETVVAQSTIKILLGENAPSYLAEAGLSKNPTTEKNEAAVTYNADKDNQYIKFFRIIEKDGVKQTEGEVTLNAAADNAFLLQGTETFTEDGTYKITYYLWDGIQKLEEKTITFIVDNTAPVISIDTTADPVKDFEEKVIYKVSVNEINFSDCDITVNVKRKTLEGTDESLTQTYRQTSNNQEKEFVYEDDGIYTVSVLAEDAAGNEAVSAETQFVIDKTAPETELLGVENDRHYNETKTVEFTVRDLSLSSKPEDYSVRVKTGDSSFETKVLSWSIEGYEAKASLPFALDGKYTAELRVTDANGNAAEVETISFVIDQIDPEIKIEEVEVSYENALTGKNPVEKEGIYYLNENAKVSFKVTETNWEYAEAYVNTMKVYKGEDFPSSETLHMTKNPDILSVIYGEEGDYQTTIQGKDAAGNYSSLIERNFVVDKTAPVFTITGVEEGKAYKGGQAITLQAEDAHHAVENYKITIEKWAKDGTYTRQEQRDADKWISQPGSERVSQECSFEEEANYKITLEGSDQAGNPGIAESVTFRVDKTAPVIRLSSIVDQAYYNETATLRILIDEFNRKDTEAHIYVTRKLDGIEQENTDEILDTANASSFTYQYAEEGEYDIRIEAEDAAGNTAQTKQVHFIVDKTKPVLAITGAANRSMTRGNVELVYQATDRNHDFSQYSIDVMRIDANGNEQSWTDVFSADQWEQSGPSARKKVTYTEEGIYEITFRAKDKAENAADVQKITFYIDRTAPIISRIAYSDANGVIQEKYHNIYSNKVILVEFDVEDLVTGVDDSRVYVSVGQPEGKEVGTPVYLANKAVGNRYYVYIPTDLKVAEFDDTLTVWANDKLGNESKLVSSNVIYNTDYPNIVMNCDTDYTVWTNKNVTFHTDVSDSKSGLREVTYSVNGKTVKSVTFQELVNTYSYDLTAAETAAKVSGYTVSVEVTNNCGTTSTMKRQVYIDKEKPKVSLSGLQNGEHYDANQTFTTSVEDVSYTKTKTVYVIRRTLDGKTYNMSAPVFHSGRYKDICSRKMIREGHYKIYAITTDGAGNQSISNTINFVIDKTAPNVKISGTSEGSMNGTPVTLDFTCVESFFATNSISVQAERTLDGNTMIERIAGFPRNKKSSSMSHTFSEDGTYKVTISATDKAGNVASSQTITFSVDRTKPEIRIIGTGNYEQWDKPATIQFVVEESYFSGNDVQITGIRKDIDGNVTEIELPRMANSGKVSSLSQTFSEDGIYEFEVVSKDEAGNRESDQIHFTIDQTEPQISRIRDFNGGYYQKLKLADSLEEVFKDLTVISYRILLNGVEYNGTDEITDEGKYNLYVEVKDELGHSNSENVEFIIDHTAPKVIFTGVKDGETVHESGTVMLALTNTEDRITSVRMNGADYGADIRSLAFTEYGSYRIEVDCVDKAGNAVTRSTYFVYSNPFTLIMLLGGMGVLVVITCIWLWIRTKRKEEEEKRI